MNFGLIRFDFPLYFALIFQCSWWYLGGDGWMVLGGWWDLHFGGGALASSVTGREQEEERESLTGDKLIKY